MERFEGRSQERNLEKDRQTFQEAIAAVSIEEIQTDFDTQASINLVENLASTKLFVLGEMHGVKENVDVIYTLFKKFGFRQLALEWEPALKVVAEKFAESGILNFGAIKDSPDGRITAGHFALIKKLKDKGYLDSLICFDEGGTADWDQRDANMAKNILTKLSDAPTLVVAGNLHAKTEPISFDDEPDKHHPMGENVRREISNLVSGRIKYVKGQFYNFGVKDFEGVAEPEPGSTAKFYLSDEGLYLFELPEAHAASVPNPHERI